MKSLIEDIDIVDKSMYNDRSCLSNRVDDSQNSSSSPTEGRDHDNNEEDDSEMLHCALGLLATMSTSSRDQNGLLDKNKGRLVKRTKKEKDALRSVLRPLQVIALLAAQQTTREVASDVAVLVLQYLCEIEHCYSSDNSNQTQQQKHENVVEEKSEKLTLSYTNVLVVAAREFYDAEEAPMRAMAVHKISLAMRSSPNQVRRENLLLDTDYVMMIYVNNYSTFTDK